MATADDRLTVLETRFDTELRHFATKADLAMTKADLTAVIAGLERRMFTTLIVVSGIVSGVVIAAVKFL